MEINILSQRDSKWKNTKLGTSNVTIGDYGCLLTCCTMLANYYGHEVSVPQLNSKFIENNSYESGNIYRWYSGLPVVYSDIQLTKLVNTPKPVTSGQFSEIDKEIDSGHPVILQVDFVPATSRVEMHYVLLVGKNGSDYRVVDPWYGDTASLTRYGVPKYTIQQYVFHSGNIKDGVWDDIISRARVVGDALSILKGQVEDATSRQRSLVDDLVKFRKTLEKG